MAGHRSPSDVDALRRGVAGENAESPPWVAPTSEPPSSASWFPTWETTRNQAREMATAFAASVRMDGREGAALLIDTGSPANICGSEW